MNITIPQNIVDYFGERKITDMFNFTIAELGRQMIQEKKKELGDKMYVVKDTPEAVAVLAQADVVIAKQVDSVDNVKMDAPVSDIITQ